MLYKRKGSPYWWGSFYDPNIKDKVRFSTKEIKKSFAKIEYDKKLKEHSEKPKDDYLLSDAYNLYLAHKTLSNGSIVLYDRSIAILKETAGDKPLTEYSRSDYYNLIKKFEALKLEQNSKAIYTRHLRAFFNWLMKENLIRQNIIIKVKGEEKDVEPISEPEIKRILEYLYKKPKQYNLVKFLLLSGMRIGEALPLKWRNIDFINSVIKLKNFKGKRDETIPLIKELREHLIKMIPDKPEERLFHWKSYDSTNTFWDTLNRDLKTHYTIHQLRKTCGSLMANAGVNALFLQRYLRHTDIKTTMAYYVKLDMDKMRMDIDNKVQIVPDIVPGTDADLIILEILKDCHP